MGKSSMTKLSTTQLAKKLGFQSKELFGLLLEKGWIKKSDDKWLLTAKGEFEQGSYRQSDKFGQYIVWPESLVEHPLFKAQEDKPLTVTRLGEFYELPRRRVNLLLSELGWIKRYLKGWQVTAQGEAVGGRQQTDQQSGVPYVVWPRTLRDNPDWCNALQRFQDNLSPSIHTDATCVALDGHGLRSAGEVRIDNWLYMAEIAHACYRPLPLLYTGEEGIDGTSPLTSDFYLPQGKVYIEYWGHSDSAYLKQKMRKRELYQQYQLNLIELEENDLDALDTLLPRELLKYGIE